MNPLEIRYKKFCDFNNVSTFFFHQSPQSYTELLRKKNAKRPDFYHATMFGDFFVDVKTSKTDKCHKFILNLEDFYKLSNTERLLKKVVLIAFPIDPWMAGDDWGYIPLSKIDGIRKSQEDLINKGFEWIGIKYSELKRINHIYDFLKYTT